ncbi:hypothetical protein C8Q79DRAFT_972352 [Trametes meyenii]|nr:hypothetical protein C8Q79DRAFT_972352 [Trametes meyenii]
MPSPLINTIRISPPPYHAMPSYSLHVTFHEAPTVDSSAIRTVVSTPTSGTPESPLIGRTDIQSLVISSCVVVVVVIWLKEFLRSVPDRNGKHLGSSDNANDTHECTSRRPSTPRANSHQSERPSLRRKQTTFSKVQLGKTNHQLNTALRRTKSFSAHLLTNSTKPILTGSRMLKNQIASSKELEVSRTARLRAATAEAPLPLKEVAESEEPGSRSPSKSEGLQIVRESSAAVDVVTDPVPDPDVVPSSGIAESPVSDVVANPAPNAAETPAADVLEVPTDDAETFRPAEVSRGWFKQLNCTVVKSRRSSLASTISSLHRSAPEMSSPPPSSSSHTSHPEQNPENHTPGPKARGALDRLRTCGKSKSKKAAKGEPVRYARPARPENSLPGVVFSQRYESPLKAVFKAKPGGTGESSPLLHLSARVHLLEPLLSCLR